MRYLLLLVPYTLAGSTASTETTELPAESSKSLTPSAMSPLTEWDEVDEKKEIWVEKEWDEDDNSMWDDVPLAVVAPNVSNKTAPDLEGIRIPVMSVISTKTVQRTKGGKKGQKKGQKKSRKGAPKAAKMPAENDDAEDEMVFISSEQVYTEEELAEISKEEKSIDQLQSNNDFITSLKSFRENHKRIVKEVRAFEVPDSSDLLLKNAFNSYGMPIYVSNHLNSQGCTCHEESQV